jgi:thiamine transporter
METDRNKKRSGLDPHVLRLVESAVMLGLATALSMVKIFQMPLGGSVTLCSMLPVLLIGYKYGLKWGALTGFTYAVIQILLDLGALLSWGLTPTALAVSILEDYLLGYTALGLAGIFGQGRKKFILGMFTSVFLRYVWVVVAGVMAYDSFLPEDWKGHLLTYSLVYNGQFLLPDFAICLIVGLLIFRPLESFLKTE